MIAKMPLSHVVAPLHQARSHPGIAETMALKRFSQHGFRRFLTEGRSGSGVHALYPRLSPRHR